MLRAEGAFEHATVRQRDAENVRVGLPGTVEGMRVAVTREGSYRN
jgi:hypothetical protein